MFKLALLGLGTVGAGVYEIINNKKGNFFMNSDVRIDKILVRDKTKKRNVSVDETLLTDNFEDILNSEEVKIVISVMGGLEPELTYIKRSLSAGKNVVTANKEIIAKHIDELMALAKENGVNILFEASVGGGIPIINSLLETIKINKISKIQGILNGTTNYILTKIQKEKMDFDKVLKIAQDIGFAEADPTADVEGFDVLRKISILASLSFKTVVREEDVHRRGISNVTLSDILMAKEYGYIVKYLGQALLENDGYSVSVTPVLIKKASVISNVNEEYNIVLINGNIIGELCFMGKGAGKDATANAVVSDIINIINGDVNYSHVNFDADVHSSGLEGIRNRYYIRASVENYEEFSDTLDLVMDTVKKSSLKYAQDKVFFITEELNSIDMKALYEKLQKASKNVFYARLEDNLL